MLVNLGQDLQLHPVSEPLLAPPQNGQWDLLWSSEHTRYGGSGFPRIEENGTWKFPGHSLVVMNER
jgi:maltooligosyltrehalose trehalohydrolase